MLTVFSPCSKNYSLAFYFWEWIPIVVFYGLWNSKQMCHVRSALPCRTQQQCWAILPTPAEGLHLGISSIVKQSSLASRDNWEKSLNCVQQMVLQIERFTDFISVPHKELRVAILCTDLSSSERGAWGTCEATSHTSSSHSHPWSWMSQWNTHRVSLSHHD